MESQQQYPQQFSFEFFPPKTPEGAEKLIKVRGKLGALKPKYFSVTFRLHRFSKPALMLHHIYPVLDQPKKIFVKF